MDLKEPLSIEQQISRLAEHGMIIKPGNESEVEDFLNRVSYYRLSGYTMHHRKTENDSDFIKGSCTFEGTKALYEFDQELRNLLREYLEIVEIYFRMQIAHHFAMAKCVKPPHDQHYDRNNFYSKEHYDQVMADFEKQKKYFKDSMVAQHHQTKYQDKYPIWVMAEMLSFSNLSKLYSAMYYSEKDAIAKAVGSGRGILVNNLHCLSVLRNKCAHGGRLCNMKLSPPVQINKKFLRKYPEIANDTLFAFLLVLLKRLPTDEDRLQLVDRLRQLIKKHREIDLKLFGFPESYETILQAILAP